MHRKAYCAWKILLLAQFSKGRTNVHFKYCLSWHVKHGIVSGVGKACCRASVADTVGISPRSPHWRHSSCSFLKQALDGFLWLTWLGIETPGLQTLISLGNVPQAIIGKIWRTNIPDSSSSLRWNSAKASFLNYYVHCTTMLIILKKRVSKQLNKSNGKFLWLLSPLLTFATIWKLPSCRLCG